MIPSRILSNSMQNKENKLTMLHNQTKDKKESLQNLRNQYAKNSDDTQSQFNNSNGRESSEKMS